MSFEWKMPVIVAAVCLVLSLLTGIFAGVHFWVLVLRSVLTASGCGLAAIGLRWFAKRFLPGIAGADGTEADGAPETGRSVDIRVGEGEEAGNDSGSGAKTGGQALARGEAGDESERDAGFVEDLEELKASPILAAGTQGGESAYASIRSPELIDDVDVLPDLDIFTDSFMPPPVEGEGQGSVDSAPSAETARSSRGARDAKSIGADDPDTVVQAVRTMLSRERKG